MRSWIYLGVAAPFLLVGLTACEGQNARDILGLDRRAPDEFRVVSRPPLSTPPDFQLRPPVEGARVSTLPPADLQAKSLVVDGKDISGVNYDIRRKMGEAETAVGVVDAYEGRTSADKALLNRAGATGADSEIRQRIYEERIQQQKQTEENWLFPRKDGGVIVDAEEEKKRLEANKEAGKPVTEGETPVVEPKERGVLENIF